MKRTNMLIKAIALDDTKKMNLALLATLKEKVNTALDIKRVAVTADIYNKVSQNK